MNTKELKEKYSNKTLGEIRGIYEEKIRISIHHKTEIKTKAQQLVELDFDTPNYADKAKNLINDIAFYKSDIKDDETELKILKPIFEKKEQDGINQAELDQYIKNNINIQILIDSVNQHKQDFIDRGSKVWVSGRDGLQEITLSLKETNYLYNNMLYELIAILKDNIGNITEVKRLEWNNKRGMDGQFVGEKGCININTILAGGYNIQKLHYRTLVYKFNY